ncbi:MAG: flagellar basal body-associated FliL family protein [Acidimicrobiales bacterium]
MAKKKSDDAEEEEGGGGKKKIIMAVGAVAALGLVYNFVLKSEPPPPEEMAMVDVEPVEGEIVELPEMVVNLEDDEVTYVRIGVALILEEGTLAADFEAESAIAKDIVLDTVSSLTAADLRGSRQDVKDDLSVKVREAYGDEKVVRVLITSLVMQ